MASPALLSFKPGADALCQVLFSFNLLFQSFNRACTVFGTSILLYLHLSYTHTHTQENEEVTVFTKPICIVIPCLCLIPTFLCFLIQNPFVVC